MAGRSGDFVHYGSEASPSAGSVLAGAEARDRSLAAGWQAIGLFMNFSDRYVVNVPTLASSITRRSTPTPTVPRLTLRDFTAVVTVRRIGAAA